MPISLYRKYLRSSSVFSSLKSVGKFDEIKTIITSLSSRVVSVEENIINCQAKMTEVENSVQGVGNLFDNLESDCDKNKSKITNVGKKFDSLKPYCGKNRRRAY
jgi:peptidoglycan hydrolase CwlO-like protein